ncbi:hypothetical protein ACQX0N_06830 [Clostridium tepidum]|jgi:hypothetical protein|nr:hypothetical protein [Clostridium tepidum]MCR1933159.1 hypothetical protein [Clostridium tepidum]MDU6877321.1 hypothetical protein [Clostridium botulinum]
MIYSFKCDYGQGRYFRILKVLLKLKHKQEKSYENAFVEKDLS